MHQLNFCYKKKRKRKVHLFIYCIHSFLNKLLYFLITSIIPKFFMECPFKEMTTVFEISKKYNLFRFIIKITTNVLNYWTIEMTTIYIFFLCSSLYCINLSSCVINLRSFMKVTINWNFGFNLRLIYDIERASMP